MGTKTAINHVVVGGSHWNPTATTPIMTFIEREDPILVLQLLEAGSHPEIGFGAWLKGWWFLPAGLGSSKCTR